jgi:hypothetical protein
VVLVHARALLADNPHTIVIDADVRDPTTLLADPALRELIDFDQPVAVLLVGILYFFPEEGPEELGQAQELYRSFLKRAGDARRTRKQVLSFFDGLEFVEPGLVPAGQWRPDPATTVDTSGAPRWMLGGVGRTRTGS